MKLITLDRRHAAHDIMKYYADPEPAWVIGMDTRFHQFQQCRIWCWEAFGPGVERDYISIVPEDSGSNGECCMVSVNRWAWHVKDKEMRLYFRDDETASAFMFQWG